MNVVFYPNKNKKEDAPKTPNHKLMKRAGSGSSQREGGAARERAARRERERSTVREREKARERHGID